MFTNRRSRYFITPVLYSILINGIILQGVLPKICHAASNITSDGTMGTTVSQAGSIYNINGGTIKGTNQFHSFGLFSVGTGDTASFNGPPVVSNIIGRVTGGQQSSIDGVLKSTIPGANLYLLNPAGVLFGANASLDVSGSFHVSTADYLKLSDGGMFYANPIKSSVLTTAPPAAFGFLGDTVAGISIQDSALTVPPGKTLSVAGGDLDITSNTAGYLWAPSGQINLVSVASPGEVNLSDLNTISFAKLGNITISQPAQGLGISVEGSNFNADPAGNIVIRGGKLLFTNETWFGARGNPGGTVNIIADDLHMDNSDMSTATRGPINHPGTGVDINLTGQMLLTNGSEIASSNYGTGRGGDLRITAGSIQLGDDDPTKSEDVNIGYYGDIGSRAFGAGRGGDVYVTANDLTVKNGFFINTAAVYPGTGDAGNVTVRAGTLNLLDRGSISSNGFWAGKGGVVDVAANDILISGKNAPDVPNSQALTGLGAQTGFGSKGGLLRVKADNLQILDGGSISTILYSIGPGADIDITAKSILISGVFIDNRLSPPNVHASIDARLVDSFASGTGGNIHVVADSLQITNGGFIASGLYSGAPGNAGNITVKTSSLEVSERGGIFASSFNGTGNAGRLDITARDVRIVGPMSSTDPFGKDFTGFSTATNVGRGGDLNVTADSLLLTDRGSISAASLGPGPAGNIEVDVGNVQLLNGAAIASNAFGTGNGARIEVMADKVLISGVHPEPFTDITGNESLSPSGIASQAGLMGGSAGDIQITTGTLNILDGARISTETFGPGHGGSIGVTGNNVLISGVNAILREFLIGKGIDAEEAGRLASAGILAGTNSSFLGDGTTGNAGNVSIQAKRLQLSDQGLISTRTTGPGTGGNIELISEQVTLSGGALISAESSVSAKAGKAGDILINAFGIFQINNSSVTTAAEQARGGDITIRARGVQLTNGTLISAESSGVGDAGNIDITTNSLLMSTSSIATEAKQADGGNIHIQSGYMDQLIDSKITASVGGGPDTTGGNITIDHPQFVILNDSQIIANAYEGRGGNIRIIADVFLASPESVVDASSALGIDGTVDVQAPITEISETLTPMQGDFLSAEALLRDRCAARIRGEKYSSFVVSGRDGLPIRPGSVLPSPLF
jgi:filamentous hemagglutinin family protein